MTMIARDTADQCRSALGPAETFGPVHRTASVTISCVSGNCASDGSFVLGGYQSYPTLPGTISVANLNGSTSAETDTITLLPLPASVQ